MNRATPRLLEAWVTVGVELALLDVLPLCVLSRAEPILRSDTRFGRVSAYRKYSVATSLPIPSIEEKISEQ